MSNVESTIYSDVVKELMAKKSYLLTKAQALSEVGMNETAQPLYLSAAAYEERIAALLDIQGQELEAAIHQQSQHKLAQRRSHHTTTHFAATSLIPEKMM